MSTSSLHADPTFPCDVGSISTDYMSDNQVRNCPLTSAVDRKSTDPTPVFPVVQTFIKLVKTDELRLRLMLIIRAAP